MIQIFDDVLAPDLIDRYEEMHYDTEFPWYFTPGRGLSIQQHDWMEDWNFEDSVIHETMVLSHTFCKLNHDWNSEYSDQAIEVAQHIVDRMKKNCEVQRARSNAFFRQPRLYALEHLTPHKDQDHEHLVAMFYINDSDGDLYLFEHGDDGVTRITDSVKPRKNRAVVFPGTMYHAGTAPERSHCRLASNFNFKIISE